MPISSLIGEDESVTMDEIPLETVVPYAAEDADISLRLYHHLLPKIKEMGLEELVRNVEAPLSGVLAEMEANGVLCDPVELLRQGESLKGRVEELREKVCEIAGLEFNLDSPLNSPKCSLKSSACRRVRRRRPATPRTPKCSATLQQKRIGPIPGRSCPASSWSTGN